MDDSGSDSGWSDEAPITNPLENVVPEILNQLKHLDLSSLVLFKERNFIGGGGYGDVFKGRCNLPGRGKTKVAIKRLRFYLKEDIKTLFEKEIYVWSKLNHPNVLPLLGYAFANECRYPLLISEWMDRGSAWSYVKAHLQCDLLRLITGIARGLAYLHEQGVVHSDIKSDNVLVSNDGDALLCDFGCARMISATRSLVRPSSGIRGTPRYLACELLEYPIRAAGHTKSTDVWAFGMTVFELLAKQRPYSNLSDSQTIAAITRHEMPSLPQQSEYRIAQTLGQLLDIWTICLDCWKHEADKRPTMHSIVDRLSPRQSGDHNQDTMEDPSKGSPPVAPDDDLPGIDEFIIPVAVLRRAMRNSAKYTQPFVHHPILVHSFHKNAVMRKGGNEWFAKVDKDGGQEQDVNLERDLKHESPVKCVRFSADGNFIAVCCRRVVRVYDTRTWKRTCSLYDGSLDSSSGLYIQSLCFSPDGKHLAFEASGNSVKVWEIVTRRVRRIFHGHQQKIYSIEFSHDGTFLVSASSDCTVRIWGMGKTIKKILQPKGPLGVCTEMICVAISPDDKLVAAGSSDSAIRIWETQSGHLVERIRGHQGPVTCVSFSPDGSILLSGSADRTVRQWDISALVSAPGRRLPLPPEVKPLKQVCDESNINCVGAHPAAPRRELPDPPIKDPPRGVIVGSVLGARFSFRDGERGSVNVMAFLGHKGHIVGVSMSMDGKWITSVSTDHTICVVESRTGRVALVLRCTSGPVSSVSFGLPGGRVFVGVGCADRHARIWNCKVSKG